MPTCVPTFLFYFHETVFGGMGREVGNRRQNDDLRGLGEPKALAWCLCLECGHLTRLCSRNIRFSLLHSTCLCKGTVLASFFFKKIYLFLTVLGLCFCLRTFSSCGEQGPLFIAVRAPLTIAASLVAEHRLQTRRLSRCGSRALLLHGMWDLPRPGLEPVSPALAGRLPTTAPPGKP